MKRSEKILLTAGATAATFMTYKLLSANERVEEKIRAKEPATDFGLFLEDHYVVDRLVGNDVAAWFKAAQKGASGKSLLILARPTEKVLGRFYITGCPEDLDLDNSLLQFTMDKQTSRVNYGRFISFCTISEQLREHLGKDDFVLYQEDL